MTVRAVSCFHVFDFEAAMTNLQMELEQKTEIEATLDRELWRIIERYHDLYHADIPLFKYHANET